MIEVGGSDLFYVWSQSDTMGPFTLNQIQDWVADGRLPASIYLQPSDGGDWLPYSEVRCKPLDPALIAAALQMLNDPQSQLPITQQRGLSFTDVTTGVLFWLWYAYSVWPSVACLALGFTFWNVGEVLRLVGTPAVAGFGVLLRTLGGICGLISFPWILITVIRWLF